MPQFQITRFPSGRAIIHYHGYNETHDSGITPDEERRLIAAHSPDRFKNRESRLDPSKPRDIDRAPLARKSPGNCSTNPTRQINQADWTEIQKLYRDSRGGMTLQVWSMRGLGLKFNYSLSQVERCVKSESEAPCKAMNARVGHDKAMAIKQALRCGFAPKSIAAKFDVGESYVYKVANAIGVKAGRKEIEECDPSQGSISAI